MSDDENERASPEDVDTLLDLIRKQLGTEIDFDNAIGQLRRKRNSLMPIWDKHHFSEYCYQLVSLLMESQKLINGQFFATDYIDEKCDILKSIAHAIKHEQDEDVRLPKY